MSRQQVDSLAAWQLGSLAAWLSNTCSLAAWQLDCLAAQLYNKCSLTAWKLGSVALQQFVACLAGWITADINSPIYSIIPKVWIKGLDQLPWKGLDRGSGSEVWIVCGTGAWSRPYILIRIIWSQHQPSTCMSPWHEGRNWKSGVVEATVVVAALAAAVVTKPQGFCGTSKKNTSAKFGSLGVVELGVLLLLGIKITKWLRNWKVLTKTNNYRCQSKFTSRKAIISSFLTTTFPKFQYGIWKWWFHVSKFSVLYSNAAKWPSSVEPTHWGWHCRLSAWSWCYWPKWSKGRVDMTRLW